MANHNPPTNGFDKRKHQINRKGRPKSFDALRELAQQIAHEAALAAGQPVVIEGHVVTVAEAIMRQWAQSKNPQLQRAFIEVAFGKVPDNIHLTNIDLDKLTDDQIVRIARGEDVYNVLATPRGG